MKINIIGSGSSGNAILFDDSILIDCGLSYKKISIFNIDIVLLTHQHGDHFNKAALRSLYIDNNDLKFCCGDFLVHEVVNIGIPKVNIVILKSGELYRKNDIVFSPVTLYHDVPNFGYKLFKDGYKHFHCTDTDHLDGVNAMDYNSATIECNHLRSAALKAINKSKDNNEFTHLERTIKTHLSVEQAVEFISLNNIKKIIPVHIGTTTHNDVIEFISKKLD